MQRTKGLTPRKKMKASNESRLTDDLDAVNSVSESSTPKDKAVKASINNTTKGNTKDKPVKVSINNAAKGNAKNNSKRIALRNNEGSNTLDSIKNNTASKDEKHTKSSPPSKKPSGESMKKKSQANAEPNNAEQKNAESNNAEQMIAKKKNAEPNNAEQKKVLIVGASSGIGYRLAKILVDDGFKVINISRSRCAIRDVENLKADAGVHGAIADAVKKAIAKYGTISSAVYCAGISVAGALDETPLEKARYLFDVNYWGAVETAQAIIPSLRENGGGKLIFIGSMAGQIPLPFESFYSSSKSALSMLAKNLSLELKKFNIQVGCLCPGGTATPFTDKRIVIEKDESPYSDDLYAAVRTISEVEASGANANTVARRISYALHSNLTPIDTPLGFSNRLTGYFYRLLPVRLSNWLVGTMFAPDSDS